MIECALSFKIPCIPCAICACSYFIYKYSLNIRCSKGWSVHNYFCTHYYQKQYNWFQKHVYWFKQTIKSDHVQLILIAVVVQGWECWWIRDQVISGPEVGEFGTNFWWIRDQYFKVFSWLKFHILTFIFQKFYSVCICSSIIVCLKTCLHIIISFWSQTCLSCNHHSTLELHLQLKLIARGHFRLFV